MAKKAKGPAGKAPGAPKGGPRGKGAALPTLKQKLGVGGAGVKKQNRPGVKIGGFKGAVKGVQRMPVAQVQKPANPQRHTLLLQQATTSTASRSWADYQNTAAAVEAFVTVYETQLRKLNPALRQLTYSVADLHAYVDSMHDISILVADPQTKQYKPNGKAFLKQLLLNRLKSAAA